MRVFVNKYGWIYVMFEDFSCLTKITARNFASVQNRLHDGM